MEGQQSPIEKAEGVGFEPTEGCPSHALQACRFVRSRPDSDAQAARGSLQSVASSGRAALADLRRVVGVRRRDSDPVSAVPKGKLMHPSTSNCFPLSFRSLFHSGRGFAFLCDEGGRVNLDEMPEKARLNYFFARAMVGRDFAPPAVEMVAA